MAALPVYTGGWTDQSKGGFLGAHHTYTRRETQFLLGATAAFLTYVGGCAWTIFAFIRHYFLARRSTADIISLQHRSIYRNSSTAQGAILDGLNICFAWKTWTPCWRRGARRRRSRHIGLRSCMLILPALFIFAFFTTAGVVSTLIATPIYANNPVLLRDGWAQGRCGITTYDGSLDSQAASFSKTANDTRAAISYSRSCYSQEPTIFNSIFCHSFVKPKLNYTRDTITQCPFGDPVIPFEDSICNINGNAVAYRLTSDKLDSNDDFGVNARPHHRVQLSKQLVCSPLNWGNFHSAQKGNADEVNITLTNYNFGLIVGNVTTGSIYTTWTYQNNPSARDDYLSFDIFAAAHNSTGLAYQWQPVHPLNRSDADVTVIFVAPNSITYRERVEDPFFSATYNLSLPGIITPGNVTTYSPDQFVSIMGCTEQYSICTDEGSNCTPYSGQAALPTLLNKLDLNANQYVTVQRLLYTISTATVYSSVAGIGPDALRLWSAVYQLIAPGMPSNQWQLEVDGWHETTLAKWQALMVEFAANPYASAHPPEHGPFLTFPGSNATLENAWHSQCRNQLISNLGAYQNVSVVGLITIYVVGGCIILMSWALSMGFAGQCGSRNRRWAWKIDGKLQSQRLGLLAAGFRDLDGTQGQVPILPIDSAGEVPVKVVDSVLRGGLVFAPQLSTRLRDKGAEEDDDEGEKDFESDVESRRVVRDTVVSEDRDGFEMTTSIVKTTTGPRQGMSHLCRLVDEIKN